MAEQYFVSKKYHEISMLAEETARKISKNGDEWTKYLTTAARLYRYPFEDQMLIYAQNPDATACASMETWNDKMSCWVNRGAKGIALLDRDSEIPKLKYVFDVSDVHKSRRMGKTPYLWKIREEHKEAVLAQLEKTYGAAKRGSTFEGRLIGTARRIAEDYYKELLRDMSYAKEGSFLEELDELNVGLRVRETLSASIAYTLLSRCGADMGLWEDELNFDFISDFSTTKALSVIGNAVTDMCRPLLMEIGKTVAAYDRQAAGRMASGKQGERAEGVQAADKEKTPEKVLANTHEVRYNALKRESDAETQTNTITSHIETEGAVHGTDIREERRLPDTQPDTGQRAGRAPDQVRIDAQKLSERTPEGDLQRASADGRTESTLSENTGAGGGKNGLPDGADGENRRSGRSTESIRSDEMGSEDEQHQAFSGGNRTGGAGLQPLGIGLQQNMEIEKPDNGENSLPGSFLDKINPAEKAMEIQKSVLCSDEFLIHKRPEIAGYFAAEQDAGLQEEYFKNSFRHGICYELEAAGASISFQAGEEGLHINMAGGPGAENETLLSWEDARFFVSSYIEDNVYLLPGEKAEQIDINGMYQQLDLFSLFSEQVGSIAMKEAEDGILPAERAGRGQPKALLPQEQVDTILRSGGGRENSRRRIYAKYQQGKTPEEMAEFLKKEYGTTGKGFEFDGKQVSVWFDEEGMSIGHGTSALECPVLTMGWQEIEKEIRLQVENGAYMGKNEAYLVDEVERGRIADHLYFFFRDGMGEMPEELEMETANYPDSHARLVDILSTPEGVDMAASHMDKALAQLESGEKKLCFHPVISKEELRAELDNLLLEKKTFPVSDRVEVKKEDFITQDEIDYRLGSGSGYHYRAFRIYDYFMEGHDSQEAVEFLKHEYGIGGCSHALAGADHSWEDHDFKGILLKKGDISKPYAEVLLSWKAVEKRIRRLIQEDKYLSAEGKEACAEYREEQAQIKLEKTQSQMEHETKISCKNAIEKAVAENFDGYRLPKRTAEGVIKEYGIERVSCVLANSVMHRRQEERISLENKEWARLIEPYAVYERQDIVVGFHPAVLNGFINLVRRYIEHIKAFPVQEDQVQKETSGHDVQKLGGMKAEPESETASDYEPGDTVTIEGTEFIIESISEREVQLRDPKLFYPIFRAESRENFERLIAESAEKILQEPPISAEASIYPEDENKLPYDIAVEKLHFGENEQANPEKTVKIDLSNAVNFHIDDAPSKDTVKADRGFLPKEKFRLNIEAIRTLEKIEGENRIAAPEEQKVLAQYVGWGGLADAFDESKGAWAGEYQELKSLLSDAEYASARESTLNAHYTSPVIIRSIYEALGSMGFKKGNVLEPAMGIGNFFGMLPENMQDSRLYGVELDGITGRIAKQLYPKASIKISGFEKADYPNDFFDVAVGNVPFGQYKVADRQYDKNNFLIHDYFFAKTLDKVRPGGVVAFVTSKGTMDKKNPEVRKYLAQRAEILGAVRLPNTAFKENAGTEVTSDILFLKKRDRVMDLEPDWVHLSEDENGIAMNSYFAEHPEMIVGKMEMVSGPYGMESTCQPDTTRTFAEQLKEAVSRIDGEFEEATLDELDDEFSSQAIPADPYVKNYSYTLVDGQVYYRENSIMKPVEMKDSMLERIKGMVGIRDCTQELINVQLQE